MSIGDITSTARGSGARFNTGKLPLELIPVRVVLAWNMAQFGSSVPSPEQQRALACLEGLREWQETRSQLALLHAFTMLEDPMERAAKVFQYGAKKYVAWNWTKGMKWSVALACALRHLQAILDGINLDEESGEPHEGHVACNLIMLMTFERSYPEGNDLCPAEYLQDRRVPALRVV